MTKTKKQIAGRLAKRKGITGEQEVARMFRRWFPECKRSFGQSRKGHEQPDLIGGIESEFFVEVKFWAKRRGTSKNLADAWAKLIDDKNKHQLFNWKAIQNDDGWPIEPIMVYRLTGCKPKMGWHVALLWRQYQCLCVHGIVVSPSFGLQDVIFVPWERFAEHLDSVMEVHE